MMVLFWIIIFLSHRGPHSMMTKSTSVDYVELKPPAVTVPAGNSEVTFSLDTSSTNGATCTVTFSDGLTLAYVVTSPAILPITFTHLFATENTFYINAFCNDIVITTTSVVVVKNFTATDFLLMNKTPLSVNYTDVLNVPFRLVLMDIDIIPLNVHVTWDFGDDTTLQDVPLTSWVTIHQYIGRKLYTGSVKIRVWGEEHQIKFEQQVGIITFTASTFITKTNVAVTFKVNGIYVDDEPSVLPITIHYGDGAIKLFNTGPTALPVNHAYTLDDYYFPVAIASNSSLIEYASFADPIIVENMIPSTLHPTYNSKINWPSGDLLLVLTIPPGYPRLYFMSCNLTFTDNIDRSTYNVIHNQTTLNPLTYTYHFYTLGEHTVSYDCSKQLSSISNSFTVNVVNNCFSENGVFDRQYSNATRPLALYTSEVAEMTSRLLVYCANKGIRYTWTMFKIINKSDEAFPKHELVFPIQQPGGDSIQFGMGEIPRGLYRLNLNVSFTTLPYRHFDESTFISFQEPPIRADIEGGNTVTGGMIDHEINAFDRSYDSVIKPGVGDPDITFSWECSRVSTKTIILLQTIYHNQSVSVPCSEITSHVSPGILMFHASNLITTEGFVFTVTVSKPERVPGRFTQLFLVEGGVPKTSIKCVINCEIKTAVSSDLSLEISCPSCTEADFLQAEYTWNMVYLSSENSNGPANFSQVQNYKDYVIYTGDNPSSFVLKKNFIVPEEMYMITVYVVLPSWNVPGYSSFIVSPNLPPYGGTCSVNPSYGEATVTKFQVVCENWNDEGFRDIRNPEVDKYEPFMYKYLIGKEDEIIPLMAGGESSSPEMHLPLFPGLNGTDYKLIVRVFDILQDYTEYIIDITLESPFIAMGNKTGSAKVETLLENKKMELEEASGTSSTVRFSRSVNSVVATIQSVPLQIQPLLIDQTGGVSQLQPDWQDLWDDFNRPRDLSTQNVVSKEGSRFMYVMKSRTATFNTLNGQGVTAVAECLRNIMSDPESTTLDTALVGAEVTFAASGRLDGLLNMRPFPVKEKIDEVVNGMTGMMDKVLNTVTPDLEGQVAEITTESIKELVKRTGIGGKDVSPEESAFIYQRILTIQNLEREKKKNASRHLINGIEGSLEKSHDALSKSLVSGQAAKIIERGNMLLRAQRLSPDDLAKEDIKAGEFTLNLPSANTTGLNRSEVISIQATVFKKNPFSWGANGTSYGIDSSVLTMKLKYPNGTNAPKMPVSIKLKTKASPAFQTFNSNETLKGPYGMHYHTFFLRKATDVSFIVLKAPINYNTVTAYFRVSKTPKFRHFDYKAVATVEDLKGELIFKFMVPAGTLQPGTVVAGLLFDEEADLDGSNSRRKRSISPNETGNSNETVWSYSLVAGTDSCMVWNKEEEYWDDSSCIVSPYSTPEETVCDCQDPPGLTFGSSFYAPPNTIDFTTVFDKFDISNASVYGTLIAILIVYMFLVIWARRQDNKDKMKWMVGYLRDNRKQDEYCYLLTVETGLRNHSGTRSNVYFILSNTKSDSGIRTLNDGERFLETGSVMTFIMMSDVDLADIVFLRIWHDNSGGPRSSWLFNKMIVENLQTRERTIFICNRWLGVERDDGLIDRIVPAAVEKDLAFTRLFTEHARNNATESHLWLSVLLRPDRSTFTRVQRLSCCLSLLFLTMIVSAMFFRSSNVNTDEETVKDEIVLGPLRFSTSTIFVSFISLLITVPISVLIVYIFKSSRPKRNNRKIKPVKQLPRQLENTIIPEKGGQLEDDLEKNYKQDLFLDDQETSDGFVNEEDVIADTEQDFIEQIDQEKPLPYFCIYIAWILVFLAVTVSAFFLLLYSMQWGKSVSEEWITAFFLSFFENIFLTDPLKVAVLAATFSILLRSPFSKKQNLNVDNMKNNVKKHSNDFSVENIDIPAPLSEEVLKKAKRRHEQESKAYSFVVEIIVYSAFIIALCIIGYGTRDQLSYQFKQHIEAQLFTNRFDKIMNRTHFMAWTKYTLFPEAFATYDTNGGVLDWRRKQFFSDLVSFRVGPVRIRQIRVKDRPVPDIDRFFGDKFGGLVDNRSYYWSYDSDHEETGKYCLNWKSLPCSLEEKSSAVTPLAWLHTTSDEAWGLPFTGKIDSYGGGGYIFDMDINYDAAVTMFQELYDNLWIDRQTRAVSVELSLYNADANLLMVVRLVAEFPEYGGVIKWHHINALRIFQHVSSMGIIVIVCEALVVVVMIILSVMAIKNIKKEKMKYFKEFWHIIDILSIFITMFGLVIFVFKEIYLNRTLSKFREDPKKFVNFEHVVMFDFMFTVAVAFLLFLITIGMMRILGYNKRITLIALVLKHVAVKLGSFGILFILIFFGFVSSGYVLFFTYLSEFKSLFDATLTCFTYLLGHNNLNDMVIVSKQLGPLYFAMFVFYLIFVLLTMFQAILNSGIKTIRDVINQEETPYGIVDVFENIYKGLISDCFPDSWNTVKKDKK